MRFSGSCLHFLQCSQDCGSLWDALPPWKTLTWFRQLPWLSKHRLMRSDYLSGSGKDLWGRTADKAERPCSGSPVVFRQVPRVDSRYRAQQGEEHFSMLGFTPCFWFLVLRPQSEQGRFWTEFPAEFWDIVCLCPLDPGCLEWQVWFCWRFFYAENNNVLKFLLSQLMMVLYMLLWFCLAFLNCLLAFCI